MLQVYKASAGSGKTFTLAREYIRMLLSSRAEDVRAHSHILAVTFTKKATAEMKERILSELFLLSTHPEASGYIESFRKELKMDEATIQVRSQERLQQILQDYSHFQVSTIDGFFQQIVKQFARELGLPATFNLSLDTDQIIEEAVDSLLFAMSHRQLGENTEEWIKEFAVDNIHNGARWNPKEQIQNIATYLATENLQAQLQDIRPLLTKKEFLNAYKKELKNIITAYENSGIGRRRKLTDEEQALKTDAATAQVILKHLNELGLLSDVHEQIRYTNQLKQRLPISDINLLLHRVIDGAETPFIYEKIGTRLHHYMIDEFQDTSTLQWANFHPLLSEANASGHQNLIVGDVKQSIYRWRNSDWRLLEHVGRQIQPSEEPKMDTNFRSSGTIVEANNHIFERYAQWVAETLNSQFGDSNELGTSVEHAYRTLFQKAKKVDLPGYVRLQFHDTEQSEIGLQDYALSETVAILEDVRKRGAKMGQVAILVRNRAEAQLLTPYLIAEGYEVESADGLLVMSHPAIVVIDCLLQLSLHPDDELCRSLLRLTYAQHLYPDNEEESITLATGQESLFTEEEQKAIEDANQLPLYEQVQAIICALQLQRWDKADAYISTFQDIIYQYCESQIADTGAWLNYWQKQQLKASIPSSSGDEAIRVMTIHKSKGLEFDVVIIPMLTWPYAAGKMDSSKLLWCHPTTAPFDTLPVVPVQCTKDLIKTHFAQDYAAEVRDMMMDNINMSYVAFTRPRRELYAIGAVPKTKKDGSYSLSSVGHLLYTLLKEELNEEGYWERGTSSDLSSREVASPIESHPLEYVHEPIGERLHLRTRYRSEELGNREFGTLMHDWIGRIVKKSDAEEQLQEMRREGLVREEQVEAMQEAMQHFWQIVDAYHWFDEGLQVLREEDILCTNGKTQRPDRIVIRGQRAEIIDWKFGNEHKKAYHEQLRTYIGLLGQMGYQAEGYLVYVNLDKIEKIQ